MAGPVSLGGLSNLGIYNALQAGMPNMGDGPTLTASGGSPFPTAPTMHAPSHGGGGGGFLDALKNVGSTLMKAANTPFDAAETGLGDLGIGVNNAIHAATGAGHSVGYLPVHDFWASFHGSSPGTDILKAAGVRDGSLLKWGGLGLDLGTAIGSAFIDPIGLTKIASTAADLGRGATEANRAAHLAEGLTGTTAEHVANATHSQSLGDIFKSARSASAPAAMQAERAAVKAESVVPKMATATSSLAKFGKAPAEVATKAAGFTPEATRAAREATGVSGKLQMVRGLGADVQGNPVHMMRGIFGKAAHGFGAVRPGETLPEATLRAPSDIARTGFRAALTEPPATVDELNAETKAIQKALGPYAEHFNPNLQKLHEAMTEHYAPGNLGVRLGKKGTRFYREFDTGLQHPFFNKALALKKAGTGEFNTWFRRPVAQVVARHLGMTTGNVEERIANTADAIRKAFNVSDEEAMRVGLHMHAGLIHKNLAADIRAELIKEGLWTPKMDHLERAIQKDFERISRHAGFMSVDEYAAHLEKELSKEGLTHEQIANLESRLMQIGRMGPYAPTQMASHIQAERDAIMREQSGGGPLRGFDQTRLKGADPGMAKSKPSGLNHMTADQFRAFATERAGIPQELADQFVHRINNEAKLTEHIGPDGQKVTTFNKDLPDAFREQPMQIGDFKTADGQPLHYEPEFDALLMWKGRMQAHVRVTLDSEINTLLKHMGLSEDTAQRAAVKDRLTKETNMKFVPGTVMSTRAGQDAQKMTIRIKQIMTTDNPGHYPKVGVQDYINTWVNGNWRHVFTAPLILPFSKWFRLASGKIAADTVIGTVKGKPWTAGELLFTAHMSGLGFMHGAAGEELVRLADAIGMRSAATPFGKYEKFMKSLNITRDNAQRLRTWFKHLQAGDDPITAGLKSIRTNLDYGAMTDVEKNFMRNGFLFYSWFRKNGALHLGGVFTRPSLYAAANTIERDRPKQLGEPGYYKDLGLLPIPGLAAQFGFGNPIVDAMSRDAFTESNLKSSILGAITPLVRAPMEYALNKDFSTGAPLQNVPGEAVPSPIGSLLQDFGLPGYSMASKYAYGVPQPAIDARLNHVLSLFLPPTAGGINTDLAPGGAGNASVLGRLLGIRPYQANPLSTIALANNQGWQANSTAKTLLRHGQLP